MATFADMEPASRRFIERYPFPDLGIPPFAPLLTPPERARVALITTAGLHLDSDRPFSNSFWLSDCSFRVIPQADLLLHPERLRVSHTSKEFDRSGIDRDINVVFPITRLKEMADAGIIGSVAPRHLSFMGSLPRTGDLRKRTAKEAARLLKEDRVDLAILTPV
ncbi:MAG: hypothetical protein IPM23_23455 [Candidatus Melainabacteria bacterium]|nr:hypothetical protein [Candidatus Melainabacteria bacterium]